MKRLNQAQAQHTPVTVYRSKERLTVAAPMSGLEPEDIQVEVRRDRRLILHAGLRGALKGEKEILTEEWTAGPYHREVQLPDAVNGDLANVTYNNGVLVVALPLADETTPATLTLAAIGPAQGERVGSHGHPVQPTTTEEHHADKAHVASDGARLASVRSGGRSEQDWRERLTRAIMVLSMRVMLFGKPDEPRRLWNIKGSYSYVTWLPPVLRTPTGPRIRHPY